jgi:hypothetical protein
MLGKISVGVCNVAGDPKLAIINDKRFRAT